MEPENIAFYWSGVVPPIAELCFVSALNKSSHSKIHLYLDDDSGFEGSLDPSLAWLESHPRFHVHRFSLSNWVQRDLNRKTITNQASMIRHLLCVGMNKWVPPKISNRISKFRFSKLILGSWHWLGWFPLANDDFLIKNHGPAYRADVFRALIPKQFPVESILYSDLDFYFSASFQKWNFTRGFVYRWGELSWANSALLFYPKNHSSQYYSIIQDLNSDIPALPWFMFQEDSCIRHGISIEGVESFDPGWTKSSKLANDSSLFFGDSVLLKEFLDEIEKQFLAVHWHNHWNTKPSKDSAYSVLLERERSILHNSTI